MRPTTSANQRGVILVFFLITIVVLIAFIGICFGVGFLTNNKTKLQDAANLAALGALNTFYEETDPNSGKTFTLDERIQNSLTRATSILRAVKLNSFTSRDDIYDLVEWRNTSLTDKEGGYVQFGIWAFSEPSALSCSSATPPEECQCLKSTPSGKEFHPCFVRLTHADLINPSKRKPNSVKIFVQTPSTSGITIPFVRFVMPGLWGSSDDGRIPLTTTAKAAMYERCTALLLDVSHSTHEESHAFSPSPSVNSTNGPNIITSPVDAALPALPYELPGGDGTITNPTDPSFDCAPDPDPNIGWNFRSLEAKYFCNLEVSRPSGAASKIHYRSDYGTIPAHVYKEGMSDAEGRVWVDRYTPSQPFSALITSFNVGLRALQTQKTIGDRVFIAPFSKSLIAPIPAQGFTKDLSFPIDVTNVERAGHLVLSGGTWLVEGEKFPNYLERGWFPLAANQDVTDIVAALQSAIDRLTGSECPASARKSIVIATDGKPSSLLGVPIKEYSGANSYQTYEQKLLTDSVSQRGILAQLRASRISVTVLLRGASTEPSFRNIVDSGRPLSLAEAISSGKWAQNNYQLFNADPEVNLNDLPPEVRSSPECSDLSTMAGRNTCAFNYAGSIPKVLFRAPNATLGKLAVQSNGIFCPLMDPGPAHCYFMSDPNDPNYKMWNNTACPRTGNSIQKQSLKNVSITEQASECVVQTLGPPPFTLVEEDR